MLPSHHPLSRAKRGHVTYCTACSVASVIVLQHLQDLNLLPYCSTINAQKTCTLLESLATVWPNLRLEAFWEESSLHSSSTPWSGLTSVQDSGFTAQGVVLKPRMFNHEWQEELLHLVFYLFEAQ